MQLSTRQLDAVSAVACSPTIRAAAGKIGMSEATIHRWLRSPAFREALALARERYSMATIDEVARLRAVVLMGGPTAVA